jgi:hypothetical protein
VHSIWISGSVREARGSRKASAIIFGSLELRDGGFMMPVLEVFGAWCAVSFTVAGLWTLVIYLGHCYRQARDARRCAGMLETD